MLVITEVIIVGHNREASSAVNAYIYAIAIYSILIEFSKCQSLTF